MTTILYLRSYSNFNATRKLAGIHRAASPLRWNVQVIDLDEHATAGTVSNLIRFWEPSGLLIEGSAGTREHPLSFFGTTPAVFIDRNPQTLSRPAFCITLDSAASARLAAKELLSLNLASYAYVPWLEPLFWCQAREAAFRQFVRLHGKSVSRFPGRYDRTIGRYSSDELGAWLRELPRPAGILAANDYVGQQVIAAAVRLGLDVPDDIAVVGIDNEEIICENTHPTLSSVCPDFEGAGERSVGLLHRLLDSPRLKPCEEKYNPVRIVRRESTLRMLTHDAAVAKALEDIRLKACGGLTAHDVLASFPVARRRAEIRFRQAVGHSVLDEIQRVRIEKAKELLARNAELSMTAIANFCGYTSATVLCKTFKAHVGSSPSDWRGKIGQTA